MPELTSREEADLLNPQSVEVVVPVKFVALVRARPERELLKAISYVETHTGAEQIFAAEGIGLQRPAVLAAASRRMDELTTMH
jgi:hypothetical protein